VPQNQADGKTYQHPKGHAMRFFFSAAMLSAACLLGGPASAQSWNTTSHVLALALPSLAGAMVYQHQDREGASQLAWNLGGTLASTLVLKSQIHQLRPDGSGNDSFPSGHTAVAFASARFIHKRYGNQINPYLLYGAASLTALARVQATQHHWRDTVGGAALGYAMAEVFTEGLEGKGLSLLPSPAGGVSLTWAQSW
jgi:membrane-associated phospholipid phosphatase